MSERDSFIEEVSEELRKDRFYGFLRRWRWAIAGVLVLVIGGAAGWEWWRASQRAAAEATGDGFLSAFDIDDPTERAARLEAMRADAGQARVLVDFARAAALSEAGAVDEAAALLEGVAGDGSVIRIYRDAAALSRVMLLGDRLDPSERLSVLEALAQPDRPFRLLALEQQALAHLDRGDQSAAEADLRAILNADRVPEGLQSRAAQLLVALGATLPGMGVPDPAAPPAAGMPDIAPDGPLDAVPGPAAPPLAPEGAGDALPDPAGDLLPGDAAVPDAGPQGSLPGQGRRLAAAEARSGAGHGAGSGAQAGAEARPLHAALAVRPATG